MRISDWSSDVCSSDLSSTWFERGLVTYSNLAKMEMLAVPDATISAHGAVSGECAAAMARGILRACPVDWGLAVTGIAGPGGGSADKPVGTEIGRAAGRESGYQSVESQGVGGL